MINLSERVRAIAAYSLTVLLCLVVLTKVMKGREGDLWQRRVAEMPVTEALQAVSRAGFGVVYIDRAGYPDRGVRLEHKLSQLLKTAPIVSNDDQLAFFSMAGYNQRLRVSDAVTAAEPAHARIQSPVVKAGSSDQ